MNIGLFTDTYLPDINGVVTSTVMLKKSLEKLGHTVYVITNHSGTHIVEEDGVIRLPGMRLKMLYGYNLSGPIHQKATEIIREYDLDLIHLQTNFGIGLYGQHLAHSLTIPCITTYHTMYEDYTHYLNPLNIHSVERLSKDAIRRLSRLICNYVTAVIAPSEKTLDTLKNYGVYAPIYVVPSGFDLEKFHPENQDQQMIQEIRDGILKGQDGKIFLYLGRMADEKEVPMLIRAFGNSDHEDWHLLLTGDGPELEEYKKLASQQKNSHLLHFSGAVEPEHVSLIYNAADAYASASLSETQGITYLEALASGKMLFGRRDPVLSHLIEEGKTGFYFDDEAELLKKAEQFVKLDAQRLAQNQKACFEKTIPYSMETFGKNVEKVYLEGLEHYQKTYRVSKIKQKDDFIEMVLNHHSLENPVTLWIPYEEYIELGIGKYAILEAHQFEYFQDLQPLYKAFYQARRKALNKDMSAFMMKEYLKKNTMLDSVQMDGIVAELVDRHLIDDASYADSHAISWHEKGYSKKQVAMKLLKKGIDPEITQKAVDQLYHETEQRNALQLARKLAKSVKNQSQKLKRQTIYQKLIAKGFSTRVASDSIDHLRFEEDDDQALQACYEKACRLYKNLDEDKASQKIRMYCLKKGFSISQINELIEALQAQNLSENAQQPE